MDAATVPTVFLTVEQALHDAASMQPGSRLLMHGAAGGVGLAACQLAGNMGAVAIGTAGGAKRQLLRSRGMACALNSRDTSFPEAYLQAAAHKEVRRIVTLGVGAYKDTATACMHKRLRRPLMHCVPQVHGVDIVLNSLTSAGFVASSLAMMNRGGVFLEIGKRDIWSHARVCDLFGPVL